MTKTYTGRLMTTISLGDYFRKVLQTINVDDNFQFEITLKEISSYFELASAYCASTGNEHGAI